MARRTPATTLVALLAALAFLLAACGATGGQEASTDKSDDETTESTGATSDAPDAPDEADPTTADTTDGDPSDLPSEADLEDLLPTDEEIGAGYARHDTSDDSEDDPDSSDAAIEQAVKDACPDAQVFEELDDNTENEDEVTGTWENEGGAEIEISLDPTPDGFTEEALDTVIEAFQSCDTITFTDPTIGEVSMDMTAKRNDDHGDFGAEMETTVSMEPFGIPSEATIRAVISSVNGIMVSVTASSGFDDATFQAVPGDYEKVPSLADVMRDRVESL